MQNPFPEAYQRIMAEYTGNPKVLKISYLIWLCAMPILIVLSLIPVIKWQRYEPFIITTIFCGWQWVVNFKKYKALFPKRKPQPAVVPKPVEPQLVGEDGKNTKPNLPKV